MLSVGFARWRSDVPSGGNRYDDELAAGLRRLGVRVTEHEVPGDWPSAGPGPRTRLTGLLAAGEVWLVDNLLVADAPGKTPAPIRDLAKVVGGGAPRVWHVPWVEAWRLGDPVTERVPRPVSKLVSTLRSLAATAVADADPSHSEETS